MSCDARIVGIAETEAVDDERRNRECGEVMLARVASLPIGRSPADAAAAVHDELLPSFVDASGSREGYWLVRRGGGELLTVSLWDDLPALLVSEAAAERTWDRVADRLDGPGWSTSVFEVFAVTMPQGQTARRLPRTATMREPGHTAAHRQSPSFCGSYLLAERASGDLREIGLWRAAPANRGDVLYDVVAIVPPAAVAAAGTRTVSRPAPL
jgi:hypothetical protein